jgi:hypothetical protein
MDDATSTSSFANNMLLFFAKVISYIFHPLFIPTYIFAILIYYVPYQFAGLQQNVVWLRLFSVFWMTAFFPAIAVFLLWKLKFINNIYLRTQKERIIPFFITMFFYWWMYYLSKSPQFAEQQPIVLKFFFFGIFISTSIGVIANNFLKVSLHGMAMGGATTALILMAIFYGINLNLPILAAVLLTGIVATSRFIAGEHTNKEMYVGIAIGMLCQIFAYLFVM